jgi:diguanylate cyclase (GGDEF)-like protein
MLGFDPRSFIVISTCVAAMCAFICFSLRRGIPRDIRGLNCWGSGCVVLVLASLLFAARSSLGILYSSFVANVAVVSGIVLLYASIRQFCDLKANREVNSSLPIIAAALLIWPTFVVDDYRIRIVIISSINAGLFFAAATAIWYDNRKYFAEYFTAAVFFGTGLVSAARCIAAIDSPATANPLTDASSIQHIYLATFAFSLLALSVGFLLMVTKRLQVRLENAAVHDGLTGIATRLAFEQSAAIELTKSKRVGKQSSLLMIDLDNFKGINDMHGHHGGDLVLKEFVCRTLKTLRTHDLFGRYGGEEFVVLLPDTDHNAALAIADRICKSLHEPGVRNSPPFTASIGVTTGIPSAADINVFVDEADKALYRAKAAGKNRVASHCEISG